MTTPAPAGRSTRRPLVLVPLALAALAAVPALLPTVGGATTRAAPVNQVEPAISGTPVAGATLTAGNGTWSGTAPITFAYRWLRCDLNDQNCTEIPDATAKTYVVRGVDVGFRLRVRVTATNADGSASALANGTSAVTVSQSGPPQSVQAPAVSGTAATGQVLSAGVGLWAGAQPISYALRWLRCNAAGNDCVEITGTVDELYTVVAADVDRTLRLRVTATNTLGSAAAVSAATAKVVKGQPALPAGAIQLAGGIVSIPVTSVPAGERLIVDRVEFSPNPVRSRTQPIAIRVRVRDTRGYVVRDALVFVRSTPLLTTAVPVQPTGQDGWVTYATQPRPEFPLRRGYAVQFFVKAYRQGDDPLAGVSGTRLVQVRTG